MASSARWPSLASNEVRIWKVVGLNLKGTLETNWAESTLPFRFVYLWVCVWTASAGACRGEYVQQQLHRAQSKQQRTWTAEAEN